MKMGTTKKIGSLMILMSLGAISAGCSAEQQLDNAQEELREERLETAETVEEAVGDGIVTSDEREEIRDEQGETAAQVGEVAEQAGELIEEETD